MSLKDILVKKIIDKRDSDNIAGQLGIIKIFIIISLYRTLLFIEFIRRPFYSINRQLASLSAIDKLNKNIFLYGKYL
jgi:hypothetical protein